ncbi:PadR family transcriptional regulator [Bacillus cereus]|nr:PadR family transcriptional regulator [Bacillus cereus]
MSSIERFSEPTLFILISLAEGNKHGYAIMEDIEKSYDIKIGPGTLYGAISRMEKQKLIEAISSKDRKKPYQITTEGKEYLQGKLKEIEHVTKLGFQRLGLI